MNIGIVRLLCVQIICALALLTNSVYADIDSSQIVFSRSSTQPLIEFTQTHDLLGPEQAIVVKVFGDGTVTANIPKSRKDAGTYTYSLTDSELGALIGSVVSGMVDAQNSTPARQIAEEQSNYLVLDDTHMTLNVNIQQAQLPDGQLFVPNNTMTLTEKNLGQWRNQTPDLTYRSQLHEIETQILSIANDNRRRAQ